MRKIVCLLLAVMMIGALAACSGSDTAEATDLPAAEATETAADGVDVDLTAMSATMVFAEVQNMALDPKKYIGKTVRMDGAFSVTETDDSRYFACIIADATACCAQGIEFVWAGEHSYPEDYPEDGTEITVTGVFTTYMEGQQTFLQLQNADVQF